ncbi:polyprenyl synthetase family protein [Actinokineospora auranticolor]|uniref:Geranylgeranyl diphosphate synthase type I n=1 Tax=Actinokineospora auranticolor TaxID=155976 RepID=A0A2S6GSV8_9PSEU|nr:polyprenyl synthetase family protein [Actinokineospora auranticolor]PPK68332.1 geranylgeranyl diphosphate synthase type I [Actinokineospora auranticolor]
MRAELERRSAGEVLAHARAACAEVLRGEVDHLPGPLRLMVGYHLGWWDEAGTPTARGGGKGLRPALAIAAGRACGDADAAVPAAAAVESVHDFTLIHDDIMDGDRMRRGRPTVWTVWGVGNAILVGDTLHSLATRLVAAGMPAPVAAVTRLDGCVVELCHGQYEDCAAESGHDDPTLDRCVRTALRKTGSLFGAACALGAMATDADQDVVAALDAFGRDIGVAFQVADDLIGIWGDPAITGKPVGADLSRRRHSLPIAAALCSGTAAGRELADMYASNQPVDIDRAATLVDAAGGRGWASDYAAERVTAALAHLADLPHPDDLRTLATLAGHREA